MTPAVPRARLLPGQAALIQGPHCGAASRANLAAARGRVEGQLQAGWGPRGGGW